MCDMLRAHLLSVLLQAGALAAVFRKQESIRSVGTLVTLMWAAVPSLLAIFTFQISKNLWSTRETIALDSNFQGFQTQNFSHLLFYWLLYSFGKYTGATDKGNADE